jgi:precorrin-4 methylase
MDQINKKDPQYNKITNKDVFKFLSGDFDYFSRIQEVVRKTTSLSPTTLAVLGVTSIAGVASFGVVPIALGASVSGLLL